MKSSNLFLSNSFLVYYVEYINSEDNIQGCTKEFAHITGYEEQFAVNGFLLSYMFLNCSFSYLILGYEKREVLNSILIEMENVSKSVPNASFFFLEFSLVWNNI